MNRIIPYTLLLLFVNFYAKAVEDDRRNVTFYNIDDAEKLFEKFIKDYKKVYKDDAEYKYRLKMFTENLEYINRVAFEMNQNTLVINECADMETFNTADAILGKSVAFLINYSYVLYIKSP